MDVRITLKGAIVAQDPDAEKILVTHNLDLTKVQGGFANFDQKDFFSCICFSSRNKSSDFSWLRSKHDGKPIGWYIPSLYFAEPELFSEIRFLSDFAYAAFLDFWHDEGIVESRLFSNQAFNRLTSEIGFSDLLGENSGFIVISKKSFKESCLRLSDLNLSLLQNGMFALHRSTGYRSIEDAAKIALSVFPSNEAKNIHIRKLPKACSDVGSLLSSVLSMAHEEISGIGGFLYLYQVAEHLTEVRFASLVNEATGQFLPPWKLKDKLSEITSERYRLKNIAHSACRSGANMAVFDTLGDECKSFLAATGAPTKGKDQVWIEWVYDVRNIIVHNHLTILRAGTSARIVNINSLLHRAVLELIFHS